nr:hypothetical protein [uncultured Draconibacterium sp.]
MKVIHKKELFILKVHNMYYFGIVNKRLTFTNKKRNAKIFESEIEAEKMGESLQQEFKVMPL